MNEDAFFAAVVELTKANSDKPVLQLLKKDSRILTKLILNKYKKSVLRSASMGKNYCYICIYHEESKYLGSIPIHNFVSGKFDEQVDPILATIQHIVGPFEVKTNHYLHYPEFHELFADKYSDLPIRVISLHW